MSRRNIAVFALIAALFVVAWIAQRSYRAMHTLLEADPPAAILKAPERTGIAGLVPVTFVLPDPSNIRVAGWYVPSRNGAAVVVAHGTNSDRSSMLPEMQMLAAAGFGALAFDWPGLGESQGTVRWDGSARDALSTAVGWLASQPGVDPKRIGGLGFSIGGFVMVQVAARDPRLRALVLEAPPPDFVDYIQTHSNRYGLLSRWPAWVLLRNAGLLDPQLAPVNLIASISPRPVLLLSGTEDPEVPTPLVRKLFDAAREPKAFWVVSGADHGGYLNVASAAAEFTQRVDAFFASALTQ